MKAQAECQKAAVQFQRAAGIHAAAKVGKDMSKEKETWTNSTLEILCALIFCLPQETISLAEERFADNSGEWKFDNAWQEMLNHATIKVERVLTKLLRLTFYWKS